MSKQYHQNENVLLNKLTIRKYNKFLVQNVLKMYKTVLVFLKTTV